MPKRRMTWTDADRAWLRDNYPTRGKRYCAEHFGVPESTIRSMASTLKLKADRSSEFFADWQARAAAAKVGRKRPDQALVMKQMHADGRLGKHLFTPERAAKQGAMISALWKKKGHPRGMLGKSHTESTREVLSSKNRVHLAALAKSSTRGHGSWKSDWREIDGQRKYFRSRWEANYARYLGWLRRLGEIDSWEHEPQTFWFEGIKRGCVSYLPDFRVTYPDGRIEYHEVKGWMDDRSKTKIRRMAKYHPKVVLRVIDGKAYKALGRSVMAMIDGWE